MTTSKKFIISSILFIIWNCLVISYANAGTNNDFKSHALQAQVIQLFSGVPASVQLAHAYCETNFGARDTIGFFDKKLNRIRYLDTIGYHYNNIFSIMDFENDYWKLGFGFAFNWDATKRYKWRRYAHPLISWIDHAYFFMTHNPTHLYRPWEYWCDNPVKYGKKGYWVKIKKTIIKYNLQRFDL